MIACGVTLVLSFLDKWQCTGPTFDAFGISADFGRLKNSNLCYTDIQQLWIGRGIREHLFPYVSGRLIDGQLTGGAIEYPVLTGLFMWVTGLFAHNDAQFLAASAIGLAPFGLLTAGLLGRMTGARALIWAAAPALVFYGFLNWDLLVTASFAVAVWCWWRGRLTATAIWLGVGTALKLYPALFVLPLAVSRLAVGDRRGAARVVATSAGVYLVCNLPFILVNPAGWWATYAFQSGRGADITTDSIWFWGFPSLDAATVNRLSAALIALSWAVALAVGWWRARGEGDYPWLGVCAAMLCGFLLFNKVHSPQYMLWLLPFFVLVRIRAGWWLAYMAADTFLFVGLFQWYQVIIEGGDFGPAKVATLVGVWGRAGMLVLLFAGFLRGPLALRPWPGGGQPSSPDGSVGAAGAGRDGAEGTASAPGPAAGTRSPRGSECPNSRTDSPDSDNRPDRSDSSGHAPAGSSGSHCPARSADPAGPAAVRAVVRTVVRTVSRSGVRMSRTTSTQYTSTAASRISTASRNHCSSMPLLAVPRYQYIRGNHRNASVACQAR